VRCQLVQQKLPRFPCSLAFGNCGFDAMTVLVAPRFEQLRVADGFGCRACLSSFPSCRRMSPRPSRCFPAPAFCSAYRSLSFLRPSSWFSPAVRRSASFSASGMFVMCNYTLAPDGLAPAKLKQPAVSCLLCIDPFWTLACRLVSFRCDCRSRARSTRAPRCVDLLCYAASGVARTAAPGVGFEALLPAVSSLSPRAWSAPACSTRALDDRCRCRLLCSLVVRPPAATRTCWHGS
jgi:hypothetical protein